MVEGNQISVRNKGYCFTINAINSYRAHMSKISAYSTVSSWLNTVKLKMLLKSWAMRLSVWFPCLELKDASRKFQAQSRVLRLKCEWKITGVWTLLPSLLLANLTKQNFTFSFLYFQIFLSPIFYNFHHNIIKNKNTIFLLKHKSYLCFQHKVIYVWSINLLSK